MNNRLLLLGITILLLTVGLSGCYDYSSHRPKEKPSKSMTLPDGIIVTGDIDKIQILNYSIATENGSYFDYEKIADGFVYSENASRYKINGRVKNIAGEMLGNVKVYVEFYDSNDTYLDSEYDYKYDLPDGYIWDFEVTYSKYQDYFEYVDHIGFDISV